MNQSFRVNEIEEGFWAIEDGNVRCWLLEGKDSALLVDTGFGKRNLRALVEELTQLPLIVVNTHGDPDHIGGNPQFAEEDIYMHPAEFIRYQGECFPEAIWEGDVIDLGDRFFEIIHLPGHTPGSIALLDRENRLLISGDIISKSVIYMFGPFRSLPAFCCSLEKLIEYIEDFDIVYPSHGPYPLTSDSIDTVLEAGRMVLDGEVQGNDVEVHGKTVPIYQVGEISFLYIPR